MRKSKKRYTPNMFETMQRIANVLDMFGKKDRKDMAHWLQLYATRRSVDPEAKR